MIALSALLLALSFVPGTDEEVTERTHVHIAGDEIAAGSCNDVAARDPEPGVTTFNFRYQLHDAHRLASGRYTGKVVFSLGEVVIHAPKSIVWPHMSEHDRTRAEALQRAILHHEVGHVRIAEAVRDELNTGEAIVAPDPFALRAAVDAVGRAGFARFTREEREYDALVDHGRLQQFAPTPLRGPDTTLLCP